MSEAVKRRNKTENSGTIPPANNIYLYSLLSISNFPFHALLLLTAIAADRYWDSPLAVLMLTADAVR
jgi:hypothetical protein